MEAVVDGHRFDGLARSLASLSRRDVLKWLAGAVAAGSVGLGRQDQAAAQVCRATGRVCGKDKHCCSGFCGPKNATGRRTCQCRTAADCPASGACHAATCTDGLCTVAVTAGAACDDGNPCTENDVCTADGHCRGVPKSCPDPDQCHTGVCDPKTGACASTPKANGAACTAPCITGGACQNGLCQGTPATCPEIECQTGVCDATTGNCSYTPMDDYTGCGGDPSGEGPICIRGECVCVYGHNGCLGHGGGGGDDT
jgi:hypothetical protein